MEYYVIETWCVRAYVWTSLAMYLRACAELVAWDGGTFSAANRFERRIQIVKHNKAN